MNKISLTPAALAWPNEKGEDNIALANFIIDAMRDTYFSAEIERVPLRPLFLPQSVFKSVNAAAEASVKLAMKAFALIEQKHPNQLFRQSQFHSDTLPSSSKGWRRRLRRRAGRVRTFCSAGDTHRCVRSILKLPSAESLRPIS